MRSIFSGTCIYMRSCWRARLRSSTPENPMKRRIIPSSTVAHFCWIRRSWRKRGWRRAARWRASRSWRCKLSRLKYNHRQLHVSTEKRGKSGDTFNLDRRAIGEHFGDALHYFGGIIAHSDHGIGSVFAGVLQQKFKSILARLLAEVRENGDVSPHNGLKRCAEIPYQAPRAHDNSANDSEIADNPIAGQFE